MTRAETSPFSRCLFCAPPQVSRADRVKLSLLVNQLSSDELGQLVDMIQRDCPQALNEVRLVIDPLRT